MTMEFVDVARGSRLIPTLSPHAEVAVLARALYRDGWDEGNTGHMTYRQPDDTFLVLCSDYGWDEARPEQILQIDLEGNVLAGEYHKLHAECMWTVHQHPRFATIWAALGRIPRVYHQKGASIDEQIAMYEDFEGIVSEPQAARAAAAAVDENKPIVLLRNHGAFVVGDDIRQVYSRAHALELRCRLAWYVEAVGPGRAMPDDARRAVAEITERRFEGRAPGLWEWAVRRELRLDPTLLVGDTSL
jgi:L-fuculose-phosphate aldolase